MDPMRSKCGFRSQVLVLNVVLTVKLLVFDHIGVYMYVLVAGGSLLDG